MTALVADDLSPPPLRQDATVIGLVGLAHAVSHFSQLLLAPLFPWLKEAFGVSYTEVMAEGAAGEADLLAAAGGKQGRIQLGPAFWGLEEGRDHGRLGVQCVHLY